MSNINPVDYNRGAWNRLVDAGNRWTVPVSAESIAAARAGCPEIRLTPETPLPSAWIGDLVDRRVLCLAGGGGQQAPVLAAAGARVTTLDNSDRQLEQDQLVARREGLTIEGVRGDMRDLSMFGDGSFDLIVNPCSNCFCPELQPVWDECVRVLRPGGELLGGFINPVVFLFDYDLMVEGELAVRHRLPYRDLDLGAEELEQLVESGEPLWFGHTLEDQIGGQVRAGLRLVDFFEDRWGEISALSDRIPVFGNTRAKL